MCTRTEKESGDTLRLCAGLREHVKVSSSVRVQPQKQIHRHLQKSSLVKHQRATVLRGAQGQDVNAMGALNPDKKMVDPTEQQYPQVSEQKQASGFGTRAQTGSQTRQPSQQRARASSAESSSTKENNVSLPSRLFMNTTFLFFF